MKASSKETHMTFDYSKGNLLRNHSDLSHTRKSLGKRSLPSRFGNIVSLGRYYPPGGSHNGWNAKGLAALQHNES